MLGEQLVSTFLGYLVQIPQFFLEQTSVPQDLYIDEIGNTYFWTQIGCFLPNYKYKLSYLILTTNL